jgi:hypothetical protein
VIYPVAGPSIAMEDIRRTEEQLLLAGEGTVFTARVDPNTSACAGRPLRLAVDPARFHYFDVETGARLPRSTTTLAGALTGQE